MTTNAAPPLDAGEPEAEVPTLTGPPLPSADDIGPLTLGALLIDRASRFGSAEALVFDDPLLGGETVRRTYEELLADARRVARALLADGVGPRSRVGILMANRPEAVAALFGAWLAGAVAVPLSTFSTRPELSFLIAESEISVLLAQTSMGRRGFAEDVSALCPSATGDAPVHDQAFPQLRRVVALGPIDDGGGLPAWADFLDGGDHIEDDALDRATSSVQPADPTTIIFSSGTTDRPKGVIHRHEAVARQFWFQAELFDRDPTTRVLCPLPLFWTAGLNLAMGATLAGGACWVGQEGFDAGESLRLIERERVTEPHLLPHQAKALEEHPDWATADLSSCTKVFGKSVFTRHPTVRGDTRWNMPIGYGSSETCSFVTALPWTTPRPVYDTGTYGRLLPGNELRVIDAETGRALGPGEEGELRFRGPTLMEQYLGRDRAESFDAEGFFPTGDVGSYDAEGLVYFSGRTTEMIKTSGAAVSPAEIEVQVQAFDAIRVARVIAVPDDRRDQIVVLCVELKAGAHATEDEIRAFLAERLASYKVPRRVLILPESTIPMSASGTKVDTRALTTLARRRLTGDQP